MKYLLFILFISSAYAEDYTLTPNEIQLLQNDLKTNPTQEFDPARNYPSVGKYVPLKPLPITKKRCDNIDILGNCTKKHNGVVTKYKLLPKATPEQIAAINDHFRKAVILKSIPELKRIFKK